MLAERTLAGPRCYRSPVSGRALSTRLFAIDLRALAVLRIALGAIVLFEMATRAYGIPWFYADAGFLPRLAIPFFAPPGPALWSGAESWFVVLFVATGVAALAMVAGLATRAATVVCWATMVSLWWRNPGFSYGYGDLVLIQLLFWSIFLPMDGIWSRRAAGPSTAPGTRVLSPASVGLMLLMPLVYFFSALLKFEGSGWLDGKAIWYATGREATAMPFGSFLRDHLPFVLDAMSYGTLAIELLGPILLFVPWRTEWLRILLFVAFTGFQIGLGLSMWLWIFPVVSIVALLPVLPPLFWDRGAAPASDGVEDGLPGGPAARPWVAAFLWVCVAYVGFSNVERQVDWRPPNWLNRTGKTLGINQGWTMYSRMAPVDYYLEVHGRFADGSRGAIDDWGRTATHPVLAELRGHYRAALYFERLANVRLKPELRAMASWTCRSWQPDARGGLEEVELVARTRRFFLDGREPEFAEQPIARMRCRKR